MTSPVVIGIDPGMEGAIALYAGRLVHVHDMPIAGRHVDPYQLASIFDQLCQPDGCDLVIVEQQQSMPKQGVSTTFKIGNNFGICHGVAAALGYRVTMPRPVTWKRRLSVRSDKDAARLRASQLIPEGVRVWPLKKHHGRAEAALLAYYGAVYELGSGAVPAPSREAPVATADSGPVDLFQESDAA